MEAIRHIRKITSGKLMIDNLERFSGTKVEIVIRPVEEATNHPSFAPIRTARGRLKKYANPDLIHTEKSAWLTVLKEKYK
ncbi:MAG: hypothetical protein R2941_24890 [Desulfobacterales bacterium]